MTQIVTKVGPSYLAWTTTALPVLLQEKIARELHGHKKKLAVIQAIALNTRLNLNAY